VAEPYVTDILKQGFRISVELVPTMVDHEGYPSLSEVMTVLQRTVNPSFISVTQGAGGASREKSAPLLKALEPYKIPRCAHLICGYSSKEEVLRHAAEFFALGIRNFLVLKGDKPAHATAERDYLYASDCIRDLRARYGREICIGAGAYPDAPDFDRVTVLEQKVAAGADFAITQMCFNADTYARLAREFSIPILPGTCFIPTEERATQFAARFKAQIPWPTPTPHGLFDAFKKAGAPGTHLFVLNDVTQLNPDHGSEQPDA